MLVYGVEGKSTTSDGRVKVFKMRHHMDFAAERKYGIAIVRTLQNEQQELLNVNLQASSAEDGQNAFENAVRAMTNTLKAAGQQRVLEAIKDTSQLATRTNGVR